jgi:hypothetical protein
MADRHDNKELPIFHLFASACGVPIDPNSVEKRIPPEPDILCNVVGGGSVAFEMVELVDRDRIGRPVGDQEKLMDRMRNRHRSLPVELKAEFDKRFGNAWVEARMRPSISLNRREQMADDILEEMMKLEPNFEGTFPLIRKGVEVASVKVKRRDGLAGPHFKVLAVSCYDPIPLDSLRGKFEKNYTCGVPMELLAYFHRQAAPLEEQLRELSTFIESRLAGSRFRRVWVFDAFHRYVCFSVATGSN